MLRFVPRRTSFLLALAAVAVLAAACGPRADTPLGGPNRGSAPAIVTTKSSIPTPDWSRDGADVVFPIRYVVQAQDPDANMRWVDIEVSYLDTCGGTAPQRVELTDDLPADAWVRPSIAVDGTTMEEVRVPEVCYPAGNLFDVSLRVRDFRGNLSNLLHDQVQIGSAQGPGA